VETLITQLSAEDAPSSARETLEQWVKKAVESELTRPPETKPSDSSRPVRDLSHYERGENRD
jgi:hypothetical protein